jgi:3-oxoacyl-[acyl-carrier-protein] synthase III
MKTPGLFLAGLGVYLPEVVSAREAVESGLYAEEHFRSRGWTGAAVARDMPAPDMAILAAKQALERSGHHASDIGVHLHACGAHVQGPEGWSAQHYVLRHVADTDVTSYRIWQSCNGMMGALELAACLLLAVPERAAALLTGADNLGTPEIDRWDPGLDNAIFGDAGSAAVLSRRSGFARLLAISSASLSDAEELYRGTAPLFPPPRASAGQPFKARDWLGGDQAFAENLAEVVARQAEVRTEVALRVLAEADITLADVTCWTTAGAWGI